MMLISMLHDRANNFTLLRSVAALCVLFGHSYALSLGHGARWARRDSRAEEYIP